MTLPVASTSGPPLLPGLIAASVWMRCDSVVGRPVISLRTVISRSIADTIPFVTVSVYVPSGLPTASTDSPTWIPDDEPICGRREPGRLDPDHGEVGGGILLHDRRVEGLGRRGAGP